MLPPRPLRKLSLPHEHAGDLLEFLALERVTAATVFPGYGGVVEGICEEREHYSRSRRTR
jgi:hypothetical protein